MPGYAYERTCRRLAHRINSNTPCIRVTRNNVSLTGGPEWSNETVRNSVIVRVTARNLSQKTTYLGNTLLLRLLAINILFMFISHRSKIHTQKYSEQLYQ